MRNIIKQIAICACVIFSTAFFSYGQQLDGVVKIGEQNGYSIYVNSSNEVYIGIYAKSKNGGVWTEDAERYIYLRNDKYIKEFVSKLTECKNLLVKYEGIAEANNVSDFTKEMDIRFYYPYSEPTIHKRTGCTTLFFSGKPFYVRKGGKSTVYIDALFIDNYTGITANITFKSVKEIESLISILSDENISRGIQQCKLF